MGDVIADPGRAERHPVHRGFRDAYTQHLDFSALRDGDRTASAWIPMRPDLCDEDGRLRRGVLGYLTDATAGVVCGLAAVPSWIVTADLQMAILDDPTTGPLRADAVVRRPGRRQSLGEVVVHDEGDGDRVIALGTVNHLVITPDGDLDVPDEMPIGVTYIRETPAAGPPVDLLEAVAISTVGDVAQMPIRGLAVNPLGFLHGGLIALLVEQSAQRHLGAPVGDLALRFVGPVRQGTARAIPRLVRGGEGDVLQVDVVDDSGRPGAIATVRPARPGPARP